MNHSSLHFIIALIALLLAAGCIQQVPPVTEATPAPAVATPPPPLVLPTSSVPVVTEPYLVKGGGIYGMTTDLSAYEQGTNLLVTVALDSTNSLGVTTGPGTEMYVMLFAYNIVDLPEGYLPQTQVEVRDAGIPYKVRRVMIYPMNQEKVTAELPLESAVGSLDIRSPYNYGAILEKIV